MVPSKIEGQDIVDIGPQIGIADADTQAVHRRIAGIQLRGVGRSPLAGIAQVESRLVVQFIIQGGRRHEVHVMVLFPIRIGEDQVQAQRKHIRELLGVLVADGGIEVFGPFLINKGRVGQYLVLDIRVGIIGIGPEVESDLVGGRHIVVQLQPALFDEIIQVSQRGIAVNIGSLCAVARCAGGINAKRTRRVEVAILGKRMAVEKADVSRQVGVENILLQGKWIRNDRFTLAGDARALVVDFLGIRRQGSPEGGVILVVHNPVASQRSIEHLRFVAAVALGPAVKVAGGLFLQLRPVVVVEIEMLGIQIKRRFAVARRYGKAGDAEDSLHVLLGKNIAVHIFLFPFRLQFDIQNRRNRLAAPIAGGRILHHLHRLDILRPQTIHIARTVDAVD